MRIRNAQSTSLIACILLALPFRADAQFSYALTLGIEYNDNVNLSESDPVEETILRPGLGFSFDRSGSTLQADVSGTVEHRRYLDDTYDDNTRGRLSGHVNWIMVPERLTWTFADALGVQPVNEFAPDAPSNQQQTNVFATGPTLFFRLGSTMMGQAELRYINSRAEETEAFNSDRIAAALRGIKDLSATSSLSMNLQAQQIDYEEVEVLPPMYVSPDYDRYDAYLGYTRTLNRFDLELAAGYSWLRYDERPDEDDGGPLLRAMIGWRPSAQSTFMLNLGYRYTDAADAMLDTSVQIGAPPTDIATGDATVGAETFLERSVELGYHYEATRWSFTLAPRYRTLDYVSEPTLDRDSTGVRVGVGWALRPRLGLHLDASGDRDDYATGGRSIDHRRFGATLDYQMTRNWSWHLSARHLQRNSDPGNFDVDQNVLYTWIAWNRAAP